MNSSSRSCCDELIIGVAAESFDRLGRLPLIARFYPTNYRRRHLLPIPGTAWRLHRGGRSASARSFESRRFKSGGHRCCENNVVLVARSALRYSERMSNPPEGPKRGRKISFSVPRNKGHGEILVEGAFLYEGAERELARQLGGLAAELWLKGKLLYDDELGFYSAAQAPRPRADNAGSEDGVRRNARPARGRGTVKLRRWKLLCWNTCAGGGPKRRPKQLDAISSIKPDVVALQELTAASTNAYRRGLASEGLVHTIDSFALAPSRSRLIGPRRYGQLIASRWPLIAIEPTEFNIPWRERVLSCIVEIPKVGRVEIHNTHVPPGSSNGWTKIRHLEGVYKRLAKPSRLPRILAGDFNTPKLEHPDGAIETWGRKPGRGDRWDEGERKVITGLNDHDLQDVFRSLHGYGAAAFSIIMRGNKRRYDHVFASRALNAITAEYLHAHREARISDHAPLLIEFSA